MTTKHSTMQGSRPLAFKMFFKMFIETFPRIMLYPSGFFKESVKESQYINALSFLLICSMLFSLPAGISATGHPFRYGIIFFINACCMPFFIAFFLYLSTRMLCRKVFTYNRLFQIAAYAQVALLIGWIPALDWLSGVWRFYLIGLGLAKNGPLNGARAAGCLIAALLLLFAVICLIKPVLSLRLYISNGL